MKCELPKRCPPNSWLLSGASSQSDKHPTDLVPASHEGDLIPSSLAGPGVGGEFNLSLGAEVRRWHWLRAVNSAL